MDKTIKCTNCKVEFIFTDGEQKYLQNLVNEGKIQEFNLPKRCVKCRKIHKEEKRNTQ